MGVLETIKDVTVLVQKADNIQLLKEVLTLQSQAVEMLDENRRLRERAKELDQALTFAKTLSFRAPFYRADGDEIPFCARCWEVDRRAVHLVHIGGEADRWDCLQCKAAVLAKREEARAAAKSREARIGRSPYLRR